MNSKLEYLPVNWQDGMIFSASQLSEEYLAIADELRDNAAIERTAFNYGLLGGSSQRKTAESYEDHISNEKVEVLHCRAITRNGSRIEIVNRKWNELGKSLNELIKEVELSTDRYWYILLAVDPFNRKPEGPEVTGGATRRKVSTRPSYQLLLLSAKEMTTDHLENVIPLAKFDRASHGLIKQEHYIPPCTRINAHPKLTEKYYTYEKYLQNLRNNTLNIIEKIRRKRQNRDQNQLADDIYSLCQAYLQYFANNFDDYKYGFQDQPPIKLLVFFAKVARIFHLTLNLTLNKNHVLQYFASYATDLNAGQLEKIIENAYSSIYRHYDIEESLQPVDTFLNHINLIFDKLVRLDYNELAPRKMVTRDEFQRPHKSTGPTNRVRIKHTGSQQNLGGDLTDSLGDDLR